MRRVAIRALVVVAVFGVLVVVVVLSGTNGSGSGRAAPPLPKQVLVPPRQTLASLHGSPAAINFWASWCEPCRKEAPELQRLSSAPGGTQVVGVDYSDSEGNARSFIRDHQLSYPMLRDPDGKVGDSYGVTGLPTTAILDSRGRIVQLLRGPQTEGTVRQALGAAGSS
jgi:cytochrome c biogenesis protein CcmG/thiol:disulfide interchange protein DsbE